MVKIKFLGAAREVGRSCIEITGGGGRFLLDSGIKVESDEYPLETDLSKINAVFISHAHLDHTGALPHFHKNGLKCPIYGTLMTRELSKLLLADALKIAEKEKRADYTQANIQAVLDLFEVRNLRGKYESGKIKYEFFDAGHIPGSSSILLEVDKKKILYTGDINTAATRLLNGADTDYGEVDVMICEATYGDRSHELRANTEKRFVNVIKKTLLNGSVLVPVFAVGRAQEIALVLAQEEFDGRIYLDGMAKEATDTIMQNPQFLKDYDALRRAIKNIDEVGNNNERRSAENDRAIIISTSGMLSGGPVLNYLKAMVGKKEDAILLTGYQAGETNGRMMLEMAKVDIDGELKRVKCHFEQFDFSAHAGMQQLHDLIKKVRPKKVIFNHGDTLPIRSLMLFASELGIEAFSPQLGEVIDV